MNGDYVCFDCKKELVIENEEIKNGKLLKYKDGDEDLFIYKCNECFEKNPALTNFRKIEVYSRVVGYIRPVQQWNKGKTLEYADRKEFVVDN